MKGGGGGGSYVFPAKRRWRGLVIAVLGLVLLSMLVPLVFLLGLHNGFHSTGYTSQQRKGVDQSRQVDELIKMLEPSLSKDFIKKDVMEPKNETPEKSAVQAGQYKVAGIRVPPSVLLKPTPSVDEPKGSPMPPSVIQKSHPRINGTRISSVPEVIKNKKAVDDEIMAYCDLKYGSYCLWRREHREEMKDSVVKKLKDQLFVARAYYPSIAKLRAQEKFSREMKQNIQDLERVLSESSTDSDLPAEIEKKSQRMKAVITRAKSLIADCNNVYKKLAQLADMTEDEANFHMKQSAFLFQLAVQTMPKSFHCLSMQLTLEYFQSPSVDTELMLTEKYLDPALHHYVIFSNNVLSSAVVINSTVMHAKESGNLVFHVLTDGQNYFAMKVWFFRNTYKEATVQVLNIEDLNLTFHDKKTPLSFSLEFRVSFHNINNSAEFRTRTEYISVFSHSHYLLPEIFQNLKKIVVLSDDTVVQQDLSALWDLGMDGKVNGAMQFCSVKLGQVKKFLGHYGFNGNSCAWMSGLNVIDLVHWRELDLTNTYWRLVKELSIQDEVTASLWASLLTFQDQVYALDGMWAQSGLGHDYNLDLNAVKSAAVLHYNGNMKPWLDLGIPRYRAFWKKFLNREDQFLSQCNINT